MYLLEKLLKLSIDLPHLPTEDIEQHNVGDPVEGLRQFSGIRAVPRHVGKVLKEQAGEVKCQNPFESSLDLPRPFDSRNDYFSPLLLRPDLDLHPDHPD